MRRSCEGEQALEADGHCCRNHCCVLQPFRRVSHLVPTTSWPFQTSWPCECPGAHFLTAMKRSTTPPRPVRRAKSMGSVPSSARAPSQPLRASAVRGMGQHGGGGGERSGERARMQRGKGMLQASQATIRRSQPVAAVAAQASPHQGTSQTAGRQWRRRPPPDRTGAGRSAHGGRGWWRQTYSLQWEEGK